MESPVPQVGYGQYVLAFCGGPGACGPQPNQAQSQYAKDNSGRSGGGDDGFLRQAEGGTDYCDQQAGEHRACVAPRDRFENLTHNPKQVPNSALRNPFPIKTFLIKF